MCGCRKQVRSTMGKRPVVTPRQASVGRGISQRTPRELQIAAQLKKERPLPPGLTKEQREIEKKRRAQIILRKMDGRK
jgi:hypothetical protein